MPKDIFEGVKETHVWLIVITALWGGLAGYIRRLQRGEAFRVVAVLMHMTTSGFAGLLCWLGCVELSMSPGLTAISTGIAGYMGGEFVKLLEERMRAKVGGLQ